MNYFPKINKWIVPEAALSRSREEMAVDGLRGNEGISLWLGTKQRAEARLTHLVFLRGAGVYKSPFNIQITPELMREAHEKAQAVGAILIGQIHSHSPQCRVDLSPTDHAYGVRVPYFLSIVYPDFAQSESTTISDCGVHVFLPDKGFVRLSNKKVTKQIVVDSQLPVEILIVGQT
jgi:hypothetical protein